jgi:RHS repeat-associated protein
MIVRFRPGEGIIWYLADKVGTVRDLIDAAGHLADHVEYGSYGNVIGQTQLATGDRFLFTGREYASEIGTYYYRARYYDPVVARFISEDSSKYDSGESNLYRYVSNSPANYSDPIGHVSLPSEAVQLNVALAFASGLNYGFLVGGYCLENGGNLREFFVVSFTLPFVLAAAAFDPFLVVKVLHGVGFAEVTVPRFASQYLKCLL